MVLAMGLRSFMKKVEGVPIVDAKKQLLSPGI